MQLVFAHVSALNESVVSWTYFMQDALRIYGDRLDRHGTVFIMDGDKDTLVIPRAQIGAVC